MAVVSLGSSFDMTRPLAFPVSGRNWVLVGGWLDGETWFGTTGGYIHFDWGDDSPVVHAGTPAQGFVYSSAPGLHPGRLAVWESSFPFPWQGMTFESINFTLYVDFTRVLAGDDRVYGSSGNDVLVGEGGADLVHGLGGADVIFGGAGNDWIDGELGNFALPAGEVAMGDILHGGDGDDTVLAGAGADVAYGGSGADFLIGEADGDLLYGDSGTDAIDGRQGSDVLYGGDDADIVFGDGYFYVFGFSNDTLFGGSGDDILIGEAGEPSVDGAADVLYGEEGNDLLDGSGGNDVIYGGAGADVIDGDHGSDYVSGGPGADIMLGSAASSFGSETEGSDLFAYQNLEDQGDRIWGFDMRPGMNDGIDLRPLFVSLGYSGIDPRADGWMVVTTGLTVADSVVWIDPDGGGDTPYPLVTLYGVAPASLTDDFFLFE